MAKWADYGIFRVRYNRDHTAIAELEIRPDSDVNFGAVQHVPRATVVHSIEQGRSFVTVYSRDGKFVKGEQVRVVTIHGEKFLRTDSNAIRADNLDMLPEY